MFDVRWPWTLTAFYPGWFAHNKFNYDDDLAVIAEGPDLVVHATPGELSAMEPVVREMHTRSGLLTAIEGSTLTLEDAGRQTLAFLKSHVPAKGSVPLCGNSIGTDRRFLAAQLPDIENWLHYRSVDVSTVKELCRRWYPGVLAKAPDKKTSHRALDDVRESVAELAYYRAAIFAPPIPPTPQCPPIPHLDEQMFRPLHAGCIVDFGEETDLCRADWQGGRNESRLRL